MKIKSWICCWWAELIKIRLTAAGRPQRKLLKIKASVILKQKKCENRIALMIYFIPFKSRKYQLCWVGYGEKQRESAQNSCEFRVFHDDCSICDSCSGDVKLTTYCAQCWGFSERVAAWNAKLITKRSPVWVFLRSLRLYK